jgi:RimJ/RimL family protein N-acetyltransferase
VTEIELKAWHFNQAAQRAFERLGFAARSAHFGLRVPNAS